MLTLALLLALHAMPARLQARPIAPAPSVDPSTEPCPRFQGEHDTFRIERCDLADSGELAVLDGDRYLFARYCLLIEGLSFVPCASGHRSLGAAVFVRRRGEALLRLVTTGFVPSGRIGRPSIVANRYGHVLEMPMVMAATCDCNAGRYFLKQAGSRRWRELDFQFWQGELGARLPPGLTNRDVPWPELANLRIAGALWRRADSHAEPTGGEFSGELAIEGTRFVLKAVKVTLGDGTPIRFHGRPPPDP